MSVPRKQVALTALSGAVILALAACSAAPAATPAAVAGEPRLITVELFDFRFDPPVIDVRVGETIRFIAMNRSDLPHELFIGTPAEQDRHHTQHAEAAPDRQDALDIGATGVFVPGLGTAQMTYRFDREGELVMACDLVGHLEAGMVGVIRVAAG